MTLNPYVELLARALYNKETYVGDIPVEDRPLAKDAIQFMNARTFAARFKLNIIGDGVQIAYNVEDHQDDQ